MSAVVDYVVDADTVVRFEFDPPEGFRVARAGETVGRVREAVPPTLVMLEKIQQARPGEVKLKFGIKVSGSANWLIAKAATEGNFQIEMTWRPTSAGIETPEVLDDSKPVAAGSLTGSR